MRAQTDDLLTRYARKTAKIAYCLSARECFLSGIYIVFEIIENAVGAENTMNRKKGTAN
jgi:hypothetical protein